MIKFDTGTSKNEMQFQESLAPEELSALNFYLEANEREPPLVFEGRHDVRNAIGKRIAYVREKDQTVCSTFVIQGAPGAGKTSLLNQIEIDVDQDNKEDVVVVSLESDDFNDPVSFLQGFLRHKDTNFEQLFLSFGKKGQRGVDFKFFKAGGELETILPSLADRVRSNPAGLWGTIRGCLTPGVNPVFLLLVDESQNIFPNISNKNTILTRLHSARNIAGLKIIPVFAGLSDTGKRLEQLGITRRSRYDFMLSLFTPEEGRQVCISTIQQLGLEKLFRPNQINHIAHQLDRASDGWPRHLHHYLQTFVKNVRNSCKRNKDHLDLEEVLDDGHDIRIGYYQMRLQVTGQAEYDEQLDQIAKDHQAPGETITYKELSGYFSKKDVDSNKSVKEIIDTYVHNGILDELLDGSYMFPIPSLQTFLANDRDVDRTKELLRGRVRQETGREKEIPQTDT
ncbi:MAG: hypothetical protein OXC80_05635 [Gammaproteobacteria bacterium]|nr:hypothetical protein [Gammaproteobacteria bacterium]